MHAFLILKGAGKSNFYKLHIVRYFDYVSYYPLDISREKPYKKLLAHNGKNFWTRST